ncbi:AAA family ATPase [Streptomyces niger]|uniref:AAA family ATPase n=1 Tax=Streptomyces niger TaxID=66373 RepID=UPI00069C9BCD|nr:AAA family ATPase [Streptomyces niger]
MTARDIRILPYSYVVAQREVKLALELNHIEPAIGGVLISGQRGTAKSTLVRAFSLMARGELPVTLPINATDDRVLGGWELDALMRGEPKEQPGLLEAAAVNGLLYIDEVNLLEDHVVNIILDVASTGVLSVQREAISRVRQLQFGIVGTMNPEEGGLRPQLLDRFGLMVTAAELTAAERREVVRTALRFEDESRAPRSEWLAAGLAADRRLRERLDAARGAVQEVVVSDAATELCIEAATRLRSVGQRGETVTALSARALAAREGAREVLPAHIRTAALMALRHRRPESAHGGPDEWDTEELGSIDGLFA